MDPAGGSLAPPETDLITNRADDRATPDAAVAGRVDLDRDAVRKLDGFLGFVRDERLQHWDRVQETGDIPLDDARLLAVGGDDHDDAMFAGGEDRLVVAKAGHKDRDQRREPRFTTPPPNDEPPLGDGLRGQRPAAETPVNERAIVVGEVGRQTKQHRRTADPRLPGRHRKTQPKQRGLPHDLQDRQHGGHVREDAGTGRTTRADPASG